MLSGGWRRAVGLLARERVDLELGEERGRDVEMRRDARQFLVFRRPDLAVDRRVAGEQPHHLQPLLRIAERLQLSTASLEVGAGELRHRLFQRPAELCDALGGHSIDVAEQGVEVVALAPRAGAVGLGDTRQEHGHDHDVPMHDGLVVRQEVLYSTVYRTEGRCRPATAHEAKPRERIHDGNLAEPGPGGFVRLASESWYEGSVNKVAVAVLAGFVGLSASIVLLPRGDYRIPAERRHTAGVGADAPLLGAPTAPSATTASPSASAGAPNSLDDMPVPDIALEPAEGEDAAERAAAAASGVPALANAPKHVTFGVVLIAYAGAQGAPRDARSKADAEKLAAELAEVAKTDFAAAVKRGDAGSTSDAGKMYRGILEPAAEYALFSLDPEQVGGPVDTPRGFWVLRRIK